jgi:AraC-like DNA-binding protein
LSPEASFLHHFRQALITPVQRGEATLANLASSFAMSERTLARRLNAAGTDFRTELLTLKMQLAKEYLNDGHLTLTEVALLLGYSEQAAFSRAFKKEVGQSPGLWSKGKWSQG